MLKVRSFKAVVLATGIPYFHVDAGVTKRVAGLVPGVTVFTCLSTADVGVWLAGHAIPSIVFPRNGGNVRLTKSRGWF